LRKSTRWRETPILFVSGFGAEEDAARGLQAGANAYLAKPFDIPVLLNYVADLLLTHAENVV
jgi:DNA-binding response OmpR family regulator